MAAKVVAARVSEAERKVAAALAAATATRVVAAPSPNPKGGMAKRDEAMRVAAATAMAVRD